MRTCTLTHLSDDNLLAELAALVATDRQTTAALLAHLAEVDARKLYLPAACSSMHAYCVDVLFFSEDAAFKRIRVARVARRFPQLLDQIATGLLHITGAWLLAPHLTDENVDKILAMAAHRSKAEIEVIVAGLAPRPDLPTKITPVDPQPQAAAAFQLVPEPPPASAPPPPPCVTPRAPERFALQVTISQATRDKLERAQALLRHRNPSGELTEVIDRALDALLERLERERFGATSRPRAGGARRDNADPAYVPNEVRRRVHARDGEQCTFVSESGKRCTERGFLEIDHRTLVARGGLPTEENCRLLCRSHNQYEAERVLGADFMQAKRDKATSERANDAARAFDAPAAGALRKLGFTTAEARRAVDGTAELPAATLEERLRVALVWLGRERASRCSDGALDMALDGWRCDSARAVTSGRARRVRGGRAPWSARAA